MIIAFTVSIPLMALVFWIYLKLGPEGTTFKSRLGFEVSVLITEILGCVALSYYSYSTVGQSTDSAWWPVIAFLYSITLIPIIFLLAGIIRKLTYRKKN